MSGYVEVKKASIPSISFNTDTYRKEEQFDVWQSYLDGIHDFEVDKTRREQGYIARSTAYALGPVIVNDCHTGGGRWIRGERNFARADIDHITLKLYLNGSSLAETASGETDVKPGDLVLYDLSQPFVSTTSDFVNLNFAFPRRLLEDKLQTPDDLHLKKLNQNDPIIRLLKDTLYSVWREAPNLSVEEAANYTPVLSSLVATAVNKSPIGDTEGGAAAVSAFSKQAISRYV